MLLLTIAHIFLGGFIHRYCALLIHGGVYADVDIMLESSLDLSVAPDVGFMVPMDEVRALSGCHDVFVLS